MFNFKMKYTYTITSLGKTEVLNSKKELLNRVKNCNIFGPITSCVEKKDYDYSEYSIEITNSLYSLNLGRLFKRNEKIYNLYMEIREFRHINIIIYEKSNNKFKKVLGIEYFMRFNNSISVTGKYNDDKEFIENVLQYCFNLISSPYYFSKYYVANFFRERILKKFEVKPEINFKVGDTVELDSMTWFEEKLEEKYGSLNDIKSKVIVESINEEDYTFRIKESTLDIPISFIFTDLI